MKVFTIVVLLMSTLVSAQDYTRMELNQRTIEAIYPEEFKTLRFEDEDIDLISEWNKFFAEKNLRLDSNKTQSNWKELFPIKEHKTQRVTGTRKYYGLFNKKYHYTVIQNPVLNQITVKLKIHFYESKAYKKISQRAERDGSEDRDLYPTTKKLLRQVEKTLGFAQALWNSRAPKNVKFDFEMVDEAKDADYSLKLTRKGGGLYDTYIYVLADYFTFAHEIGHMMGIDDEYKLITANVLPVNKLYNKVFHAHRHWEFAAQKDLGCNLESLMCSGDMIYPYHYEQILRKVEK